ncbi:MAG: hypothetical protein IPJ65_38790 [Archangiaceae bacterium]|nr:hypothetical protein [Archangiaceae bacterium]
MRISGLVVCGLLLAACSGVGEGDDAGEQPPHDSGTHDSGMRVEDAGSEDAGDLDDAGSPNDGGATNDAGPSSDGGVTDAGTGSDAGRPDAGTRTDGGTDAGNPCASARLCDDFERYDAGRPPAGPWSRNAVGSGTVTVDGTHAFSGSKSVHFTVDANLTNQRAYIETRSSTLFPLPGALMYGRMMVWLEEVPILSNGPHWTTIQADGPTDPLRSDAGITSATYRYGVMQHFLANYHDNTAPDCYRGSNITPPVKRWACFEWEYDTPNERLRFWLDGVAQTQLSVDHVGQGCVNAPATHPWTGPQFNVLYLGIQNYQASNIKMNYWVDDVAVGSVRQGCATSSTAH